MTRRWVAVLLLVGSARAESQYPSEIAAGARVRLAVRDSLRQEPFRPREQLLIATVVRLAGDTLHVVVPSTAGTVAIPRPSLTALSLSRGVPSRGESALRHGVAMAAGLGLGFLIAHHTDDSPHFGSAGEAAGVGAALGFAIGGVLGAVSPTERWRRVPLPRR